MQITTKNVLNPSVLSGKQATPANKELQALRQSCRDFEAIYIQEMNKAMRKTIPDSGLFEKNMASEVYKEMLDLEMAKTAASGQGLGIGEAMYQQMKDKIVPPKLP
ncbi:MAG: rod-binding protein [Pseudomonadota bacterium]